MPIPAAKAPEASRLPGLRTRLWIALAAAGLAAVGLLALLSRPGPPVSTRPFLRETTVHKGWTFVRLAVTPQAGDMLEQTTRVRVEPGAGLERASAISFQFDLYREGTNSGHVVQSVEVLAGEIATPDGQVRFTLPPGTRYREQDVLRLPRSTPAGLGAEARELVLHFVTRGDRRMALEGNTVDYFPDSQVTNTWSWIRGPGQPRVFAPPGAPVYASLPIGRFEFPLQGANVDRAALLAFLWDLSGGGTVKLVVVGLSLLLGMGLALVPWGGRDRPLAAAAGLALMFAAVSGGYALISPPLDAPDEPDHLLSFLKAAKVPDAQSKLVQFAARSHWERWVTTNSRFEKISADDRLAPYQTTLREWATSGLVAAERSGLGGHYWRAIGPLVVGDSLPQTLLRLRWANALTVTGFVFFGALLFWVRAGQATIAPWAVLILVLLTPVAYLAMATSNYILVVGSGILLAGAVSLGEPSRRAELASWFAAALAAGIAVQCSRSGLTLIGFAPVLALRWVRALAREPGPSRSETAGAWALIAAGLVLPWVFSAADYRTEAAESFGKFGGGIVTRLPWPAWVALAGALGALAERFFAAVGRSGLGTTLRRGADRLAISGWLAVPVVLAVVIWFQFQKLPPTPTNGQEVTALKHVVLGAGKLLGSMGPGQHDFLLSLTYWNIMGWLGVRLPEWAIDLFSSLLLAGGVALWAGAARRRDGARWLELAVLTGAGFGYLAAMLVATRAAGYNLVGRYLIVFFTVFLSLCWSGWRPVLARFAESRPTVAAGCWALLPVALHLFCWSLILAHFF